MGQPDARQSLLYAGGNLNSGGFVAPIVRLARIETSGTQISGRGTPNAQYGEMVLRYVW